MADEHTGQRSLARASSRRQFLKTVGASAMFGMAARPVSAVNASPQPVEGDTITISGTRRLTDDLDLTHETIAVQEGAELIVDGDVTMSWEGFDTTRRGALRGLDIAGTVRFANEGDTLVIDQTARHLAISTNLRNGAQFGDGRGTIVFNGLADLTHEDRRDNEGSTFMMFPPEEGRAVIDRVAWPHGSADHWHGSYASNIGFSWSDRGGDLLMRNCYVWGFSHNFFYWYRHTGSLTIENCLFEHNGSRGVTPPGGGLEMTDTTIVVGGKNAAQLHNSSPDDLALGTTAFQLDGTGEHRTARLRNVHVLDRQTRCDGQKARYRASGGLYGMWYEGSTFTFDLTDCHSEIRDEHPAVTVQGMWGANPQCLSNPIEHELVHTIYSP